jgi:hypothetical protein
MHNTNMHNCRYCKNPLRPWAEWKGDDGQLYCNEFCADAGGTAYAGGTIEMRVIPGQHEMIAAFRMPSL